MREHIDAMAKRIAVDSAADDGHTLRAVWFDHGPDEPGQLWIGIHHFAVDGVSWRILTRDLATAWRAIGASRPVDLGPHGTSFRSWTERLHSEALRPRRRSEVDHWIGVLRDSAPLLRHAVLNPARDVLATASRVKLTLSSEITTPLLGVVPNAYDAHINDVLLTALVVAIARWQQRRSELGHRFVIDLEGHGREEQLVRRVDLSRTVGWFTTMYPVRFDMAAVDLPAAGRGDAAALTRALDVVTRHLRAIPDAGIGYGLLRYLNPETRGRLAQCAPAPIGFNYLGRFGNESADADWAVSPDAPGIGGGVDANVPFAHALELSAIAAETSAGPALTAHWSWPWALFSAADIHELGTLWFTALRHLVEHAGTVRRDRRTSVDVPLVSSASL
jgi:non-ribosomal peptide synthase protein (TIGR01720 family)